MHTCLAMVVSESSFGVYVCLRRPAGLHCNQRSWFNVSSDEALVVVRRHLVNRIFSRLQKLSEKGSLHFLCVFRKSFSRRLALRGWADVGLWVAVCFLAKISVHRPSCKTTFARLTQSQAVSQSFRVFITFRSMRDGTLFHFSKHFFCTKLPLP